MTGIERIAGVSFSKLTVRGTVDTCIGALNGTGRPEWFACVNPHSAEMVRHDPEFAAALLDCGLVTPDGIGVVLASRILGGRIRERVCGPDLFVGLSRKLNAERSGTRVFFLGAGEDTLAALAEKYRREFPNLSVVGTLAPPFKGEFSAEDDAAMVAAVNDSGAEVLWVGLGAPKQEKWAHRNWDRLTTVKLIGPVGAVFDFYTGRVNLGPRWIQRAGLIWLYRLCQEPRRLWRRNLDSPIFLCRVLGQAWRERVLGRRNADAKR